MRNLPPSSKASSKYGYRLSAAAIIILVFWLGLDRFRNRLLPRPNPPVQPSEAPPKESVKSQPDFRVFSDDLGAVAKSYPRINPAAATEDIKAIEEEFGRDLERLRSVFNLSEHELRIFLVEVLELLQISGELKIQAAKVYHRPGGEIEIIVPSRPAEAAQLLRIFNDRLAAALSGERANEIDDYLGERLTVFFSGYGGGEERYVISPEAGRPNHYRFSYETKVPKSLHQERKPLFLGKGFVGDGGGWESVKLEDIFRRPQYAFLKKLMNTEK